MYYPSKRFFFKDLHQFVLEFHIHHVHRLLLELIPPAFLGLMEDLQHLGHNFHHHYLKNHHPYFKFHPNFRYLKIHFDFYQMITVVFFENHFQKLFQNQTYPSRLHLHLRSSQQPKALLSFQLSLLFSLSLLQPKLIVLLLNVSFFRQYLSQIFVYQHHLQ